MTFGPFNSLFLDIFAFFLALRSLIEQIQAFWLYEENVEQEKEHDEGEDQDDQQVIVDWAPESVR